MHGRMTWRRATMNDVSLLTEMNRQLIQDERHRNRNKPFSQLAERMGGFLAGEYEAVIFEDGGETVAYALFREDGESIYLRQFFVCRHRRREGIGREAMRILKEEVWPKDRRVRVDVLSHNKVGYAFWKAIGFKDYAVELEILPSDRDV